MRQTLFILFAAFMASSPLSADIVSVNQSQLEYEIKGKGNPVVLFEAGAISGMAGWNSIWDQLPDNITAIRYSRRGEGNSSACAGNLTSTDYVKDLTELLKRLKVNQPVISVSHSYGSKVAREYASNYSHQVSAMLLVDPINPRDIDIIEQLDPKNGKASNDALKATDIKMGEENGWCLIKDIWDKRPSLGFGDIKDIPVTLIAGVKKFSEPKRLFDTDQARDLWGEYQSDWVLKFPQGKAVMAKKSGHFVQDDEPELVVMELNKLIKKISKP